MIRDHTASDVIREPDGPQLVFSFVKWYNSEVMWGLNEITYVKSLVPLPVQGSVTHVPD